MESNNG
jgi:hypothetical protein